MCKVRDENVRFGWKEWAGIFSAMMLAAGIPTAYMWNHGADKERHQTVLEKQEVMRLLLKDERELWRQALQHEREMFMTLMDQHVEKIGHSGMQQQWLDHERRIAKLEH